MKKALIAALPFVLFACNGEDDEISDIKRLLVNKWQLIDGRINESGNISEMTIDSCNMDNDMELRANQRMVVFYGTFKCNTAEKDSFVTMWDYDGEHLFLEGRDYELIELSADKMNLKKTYHTDLSGQTIIESYYEPR